MRAKKSLEIYQHLSLGTVEQAYQAALKTRSLLPSKPAPIRIERFVEKQFKTALRYEDLGPENLGCTIFNSLGAVEAILVSRSLEEQNTIPAADGTSFFGGKGRIPSVVIGGLIIGTISNGLNMLQIQTFYQLVVMGGV